MEDPKSPKSITTVTLPPGCRFYPSEQQLFSYYLTKNTTIIKHLNLYNYDPSSLPEIVCFSYGYRARKRHWYFYTDNNNNTQVNGEGRKSVNGYWKRKGKIRDVVGLGRGSVVLGTRKSFVFYSGENGGLMTDWFMYEYALVDDRKAFVLCRVFIKSRRRNSLSDSDYVHSCCAEGSVSVVRDIRSPRDGSISSKDPKAKPCDEHCVCRDNEISGIPIRQVGEITDRVTNGPVSATKFQTADFHPYGLERSPRLNCDGGMYRDHLSPQDLASILEEDFIELDDLIYPLLDTDNIG